MSVVAVVGSGGREHALAWKLSSEGHEVHAFPGSAGMASVAELHPGDPLDFDALEAELERIRAELVVIGPEAPLVRGVADQLRASGFTTFGPSRAAAALEGSKAFAKTFMARHSIPTARFEIVDTLTRLDPCLAAFSSPPVVKADGLAAGKGVTVAATFEEARAAALDCLVHGRFGAAGGRVVLEERLIGEEASFFVLTDGRDFAWFDAAQDHKRIQDGDIGPNTGGMGAYAPAPIVTSAVRHAVLERIVGPTLRGLAEDRLVYRGVLFIGLMISPTGEPRVIEYNCRFGDPEAQVLCVGMEVDLYPRLLAAAEARLQRERVRVRPAAGVVLAASGYPFEPRAGDVITGIDAASAMPGVRVFHAGTQCTSDGTWLTAGGRVLSVCAHAASLGAALDSAYAAVDRIQFDGRQVRRDIGARALKPRG